MIEAQNSKYAIMVLPQTIGTTAVTGRVDTLGYDHVEVAYIGDTAASGDVITALKISRGDTTSAFTDISTGGTNFDIPAPNTSTGDIVLFEIDKTKYPYRHFQISITGDATTRSTGVIARLSRNKTLPNSDSERGATEVVYV